MIFHCCSRLRNSHGGYGVLCAVTMHRLSILLTIMEAQARLSLMLSISQKAAAPNSISSHSKDTKSIIREHLDHTLFSTSLQCHTRPQTMSVTTDATLRSLGYQLSICNQSRRTKVLCLQYAVLHEGLSWLGREPSTSQSIPQSIDLFPSLKGCMSLRPPDLQPLD